MAAASPGSGTTTTDAAANEEHAKMEADGEEEGSPGSGTPALASVSEPYFQKMQIWTQDVLGIMYHVDQYGNVYCTEDMLHGRVNPRRIARWICNDEEGGGGIQIVPLV